MPSLKVGTPPSSQIQLGAEIKSDAAATFEVSKMNPSHALADLAIAYSPRMMHLSDQQRPGCTEPAIPQRLEMPDTVSAPNIA